ncbi:Phosphatidylinositol 4-kinase pik1alpha (PI4-kinase)(PtdIns-4-kinase) [Bulinus truncatus]|nr:Phosphatidylinositol 4-kinase pik1alpha (PI4-kinase)(PtdIns-4-kinase) [Bulinus truncatus]
MPQKVSFQDTDEKPAPEPVRRLPFASISLPKELDYKRLTSNESSFGSSPSEVNLDKSKMPITSKKYSDKVIPGTQGNGELSSLPAVSSEGSQRSLHTQFTQSLKFSGNSLPHRLQPIETSDTILTSPCHQSLSSSLSDASNTSSPSGAENLNRMLRNTPSPSMLGSSLLSHSPIQHHSLVTGQKMPFSLMNGGPAQINPFSASRPTSLGPDRASRQDESATVLTVISTFKNEELSRATNGFSESNLLGEGNFGKVYKGNLRGLECAIKKLKKPVHETNDLSSQIITELTTLLKYQHENILSLYGYASEGQELCLVHQYLSNGSLEDRLALKDSTTPLSWERRVNIILGACKGLSFLHTMGEKPLIHGDIKSANILLDRYLEAKIADLGQAKYATSGSPDSKGYTHITLAESSTKLYSTRAYEAPEVFATAGHSTLSIKSDIYALGVVFLEICTSLKAHDPNRTFYPFLKELFMSHEGVINQWVLTHKDQHIDECHNDSVIQVLEQTKKCLNKVKKFRPESKKLLEEMTKIYEGIKYDSFTSSMLPEFSQSSMFVSSKSQAIAQVQQEIMDQLPTNPSSYLPFAKCSYSGDRKSENMSVPLLLQQAYDSSLDKKENQNVVDAPSPEINFDIPKPDPVKQAQLDQFDNLNVGLTSDNYSPCLECDPAKMAYLTEFDESNYSRLRQHPPQGQPALAEGQTFSQPLGPQGYATPKDDKFLNTYYPTSLVGQQGVGCVPGNQSEFTNSYFSNTSQDTQSRVSGQSCYSDSKSKNFKALCDFMAEAGYVNEDFANEEVAG